ETVQIVCGAPNVASGQKVPVATVGSTLPIKLDDGSFLKLRKAKLRGEVSQGMICAEDELGLGSDHAGIMVLDGDLQVGTPVSEVFDLYTDTIIDIAITPNRPDATCHLGVARDLSAALNIELKKPEVSTSKVVTESEDITIEIESPEKCHRYVGKMVKGVEIKESPAWLKNKLMAIGLRPVNNVVDVTNYVMYELGQPLHAFDYDEIKGKKIVVRDFDTVTEFETLDHIERKCAPGTLFICDGEGPVAIAGVMGGLHSEVSDSTTNILIESAYFDPGTIRRTAKAQTLQTDASYRFERGIDPNLQLMAAERAAALIQEVAGGELTDEIIDIHPVKTEPVELTLRRSYLNRLLGTDLTIDEAISIVDGLELEVLVKDEETVTFRIPTFRPDLEREVDLIEEVGRLFDYNKIEAPNHGIFVSTDTFSEWEILMSELKKSSVELGFREIYTNSLISEKEADHMGALDRMISTLNPLTKDMSTLRPSLLHGFLKASAYNFNRQAKSIRFFETGNVFWQSEDSSYHEGIKEETHILFGLAGLRSTEHWTGKPVEYSVFDLKSSLNGLFTKLNLLDTISTSVEDEDLIYFSNGIRLGALKVIGKDLKKIYDIETPVFVAELSVQAISEAISKLPSKTYKPIPKFPGFEFDFAVIVNGSVTAGSLIDAIKSKAGKSLQNIEIFDVFEGESIGSGNKSLAFRLNFLDPNKTLNIKEVEPIIKRIVKYLEKEFSAKLRA
ncbi:MAG TPA: phenylalanine--tRNA ligase subunit beta, partial [Balneolaceae bacterium]|nr:phenylalanine--tRNA ligase subunit beta [Balneolaceae bacterium]